MTGEQGGPSYVVLGLGLNSSMTSSQGGGIDQPWTTLSEIVGNAEISRNQLTSSLISHIFDILTEYEKTGLSTLIEAWRSLDAYNQLPIRLSIGNRSVEGLQEGINDSGALLVRVNGELQTFHGGEVSLRAN
jgi:BirA family biotin operon repressor/biotin-[acetyl-CoA-carboxylase] ligase